MQKSKAGKKKDGELVGGFHLHTGLSGRSALRREFVGDSLQEARGKNRPGRDGEVQRPRGRRLPSVFQKLQGEQGGGVEGQR